VSLIHSVTGEQGRIRRWSLYVFARYLEMPLLGWGYRLLRGRYRRLGGHRLVRAALGWCVAAPFGYFGDTARPLPTTQVLRMIDALEGPVAVGPCRCRLAHGGCGHPLQTDIVIRTGEEAWTRAFPQDYRIIGKQEAKRIVSDCRRLGMWQMVFVHCPVGAHETTGGHQNEYVICNCCPCGCVPHILNRELGQRVYPLLRGAHAAYTAPDRCVGHGACVDACPFGLRILQAGKVRLVEPCFGCGMCIAACPAGAIVMQEA
jgi:ferredoxin